MDINDVEMNLKKNEKNLEPEQTALWYGAYHDQAGKGPVAHNRFVCICDEPL